MFGVLVFHLLYQRKFYCFKNSVLKNTCNVGKVVFVYLYLSAY
nr:MAG TPA: hypothetical protein [Bacteriophage sp.]